MFLRGLDRNLAGTVGPEVLRVPSGIMRQARISLTFSPAPDCGGDVSVVFV